MPLYYKFVLGLAVLVTVLFVALVIITGKGDAMSSGGGAIRTSFKGKASFDDQISKVISILAGSFMVLMIVLDLLNNRLFGK